MSGATVLMEPGADNDVSPVLMLPFQFTVADEAATQYWVSAYGHIGLWRYGNTIISSRENLLLPDAAAPEGVIAPLWDDLARVFTETSNVRIRTVGTAPNRHFTVEWNNWRFRLTPAGEPDPDEASVRLRFQLKLFETSNVIEFHYCVLSGNDPLLPRVFGNSATVGFENMSGTRGFLHSHNTPSSVSTTEALRFTPN